MEDVGAYLSVYEESGNILVQPEHEPSVDAAVGNYLDTGRDALLRLTTLAGDEYVTRASNVTSWLLSTPEGRLKSTEFEKAAYDEERDNRVSVGLPWDAAE